jgi:lysozyme family protein
MTMGHEAILDNVIIREGGFTHDSTDRGGATKFGITAQTLGDWRTLGREASPEEVKHLSVSEARDIYQAQYLAPFAGITDPKVLEAVVDTAVNMGVRTATRQLQIAARVPADAVMGPVTLAAVNARGADLLVPVVKARCLHYAQIVRADPSQSRFIVGWLSRALSLL